jgi:hypothetical protein
MITRPIVDDAFAAGTPIAIETNAAEAGKTVSRVEFFDGDKSIGTAAATPYSFTLNAAAEGVHELRTKVIYSDGTGSNSLRIAVTVGTQTAIGGRHSLGGAQTPFSIRLSDRAMHISLGRDAPYTVRLLDMSGKTVRMASGAGTSCEIPARNIRAGLYILRPDQVGEAYTRQVICKSSSK